MIHRISGLLMPESLEDCSSISCFNCAFGFSKGERPPTRKHDIACRNIWDDLDDD